MALVENLKRQLTGDEGKRKFAYKDSEGFLTIGIGRLIDDRKGVGLREHEIQFLFDNDVQDRIAQLQKRLPWFLQLDEARQGVLLNMSFQLGVSGLLSFRTTLKLVGEHKYKEASKQMLLSLWARQTPKRAKRLSDQMETGVWQYDE